MKTLNCRRPWVVRGLEQNTSPTQAKSKKKDTKVCLRPTAGQFVVIGNQRLHLLLLIRIHRKYWAWIRDPLSEEVTRVLAFQVDTVEEASKLSKFSMECTRLAVQILCFLF